MLGTLLIVAGYSAFELNERRLHAVNYCAAVVTGGCSALIAYYVSENKIVSGQFFCIDAISAILLLAIGILSLSCVIVSAEHLKRDDLMARKKGQYYFLLQLFILSMILVVTLNNAGLVWVAIEATTVVSTLLIAFNLTRQSLEAAWKYVIICTIGICFALLGTILLYYLQVNACGTEAASLNWQSLHDSARVYEPNLSLLAFLFILIGYGTKAGFAPMHTWLPDAYSQSPAPISALLSGGLISAAIYALIRNVIIFKLILHPLVWQGLLIFFALFSIIIVIPFVYKQNDLKRLLAYSSIENIGIITLGLAGNCYLAAYGLLFHIFNHALNKTLLFYLTGEIIHVFRTKQITRVTMLFTKSPKLGWLMFFAVASLAGLPPFAVFFSKLYIMFGLMAGGHWLVATIALAAIAVIFILMLKAVMNLCCGGQKGEKMYAQPSKVVISVSAIMLLLLLVMGLALPNPLQRLLHNAALIISN
jgi:hydrogenase-4 component F